MVNIYVIKLVNEKFYIGSTNNIPRTIFYMFKNKNKSEKILNIYKPLYLYDIYENCQINDEYKYVNKFIDIYGLGNVFGPTVDSQCVEEFVRRKYIQC